MLPEIINSIIIFAKYTVGSVRGTVARSVVITTTMIARRWFNSYPSLVVASLEIIISAWWNVTSSKSKKSEEKLNRKTRKQKQALSEFGFVVCTAAPSSLSQD